MKIRHTVLLVCIAGIVAVEPVSAVQQAPIDASSLTQPSSEGTPDVLLRKVRVFETEINQVNSAADAKYAQLQKQLLAGLENAVSKAQAAGSIEIVLALKTAMENLDNLTDSDVAVVKKAIDFRVKRTAEIEQSRKAAALNAARNFHERLEATKKEETQKGNFETAKAIADYQKSLQNWARGLSSSSNHPPLQQSNTSPSRSATESRSGFVPAHPSPSPRTQGEKADSRDSPPPPLSTPTSSLPKYLVFDLSAGSGAERYPVQRLFVEPPGGFNAPEFKTDKLVVRRIDPGTFLMGSPSGEQNELGRNGCEDLHQVTLTKPFYIGIFEVTQKQWKNVMGRNPAYDAGDARPVETVSYNDIRGMDKGSNWPGSTDVDEASFCGLLRSRTAGFLWDLPTEAQWEFACRAGTTTALNSGKNLENEWNDKNIQNLGRVNCNKDDGKGGYKGSHTTVGSYRPNAWGLYDMHGNVWEWCRDRWMERLGYDPVVDPEGPPSSYSSYRLCRGGAWASAPKGCRSAARGWYYQTGVQDRERGFRLVIEL